MTAFHQSLAAIFDKVHSIFLCSYMEKLGLKEPCDDIIEVLTLAAINQNLFIKFKDPATGIFYSFDEYEIEDVQFAILIS